MMLLKHTPTGNTTCDKETFWPDYALATLPQDGYAPLKELRFFPVDVVLIPTTNPKGCHEEIAHATLRAVRSIDHHRHHLQVHKSNGLRDSVLLGLRDKKFHEVPSVRKSGSQGVRKSCL